MNTCPVSIYTATKFEAYERARRFNDDAISVGYEISHDWTRSEQFAPEGDPLKQGKLTQLELTKYGNLDFDGATNCDILVALMDEDYAYLGTPIEIGLGLASGAEVLVVTRRPSVFFHLSRSRANVSLFESENAIREHLGIPLL